MAQKKIQDSANKMKLFDFCTNEINKNKLLKCTNLLRVPAVIKIKLFKCNEVFIQNE